MQRRLPARRGAALASLLPPLLLLLLLHTPHCCVAHGEAGGLLTPAAVALSADGAANASAGRCPAWHTENATRWRLVCGTRSEVEPPHSGAWRMDGCVEEATCSLPAPTLPLTTILRPLT